MERISLSRPSITDDEVAAAESTLRSRWLVYGPQNRAFEEELAAACGRRHAIAVSSGTAALHLMLLAVYGPAGPAPGTRLLAPAFTFPASVNVARFLPGPPLTVHLADVDPQTFCLPAATLQAWQAGEPALTMVVHQFGYPSPLPPLSAAAERLLISDAACAIGAPAALRGRAACLSFHPRKLLTTGEGGAILTDDDALGAELRQLRAHRERVRRARTQAEAFQRCFAARLASLFPFLGIAFVEFVGNQQQAAHYLGPIGIGNAVDLGFGQIFDVDRTLRPPVLSHFRRTTGKRDHEQDGEPVHQAVLLLSQPMPSGTNLQRRLPN